MTIKIAFIKFAGLGAGGTEKFLQTIAVNLPKEKFEIDYFYTNAAPYVGSDYKHADNDASREAYMRAAGINLIPVNVGFKDITQPHHPWLGSNLYDLFDPKKYDVVSTARAGHREAPICDILDVPVVEVVTLPGLADRQENIVSTVHISEYQKQTWVQAGGNETKAVVLPIVSEMPVKTTNNYRQYLNIPEDTFVFGFHQRNDDGIFSSISLDAYKQVMNDKTCFIILGGSKLHLEHANNNGIKIIQLEHSADPKVLDMFLNTLNVYAHARKDGETFGLAIAEAMSYGLPIISHVAPAMGHVETIGDAGFVCKSHDEYVQSMLNLMSDQNLYNDLSTKALTRYNNNYSVEHVIGEMSKIYEKAANTKLISSKTDDEFWGDMW